MMRPRPPRGRRRNNSAQAEQPPAGDLRRRLQSLLGFAVKAGRVTAGVSLTQQGLARGEVEYVLAAGDLAPRRLEALLQTARDHRVGCTVAWTQTELGSLLDRGPTGAVGVTDASLARGMAAAAASETERNSIERH